MGTVCKKIDEKMKSGAINQNTMFNEAQNIMQNMGSGGDGMMRQMGAMMGMNAMGGSKKDKKKKKRRRY